MGSLRTRAPRGSLRAHLTTRCSGLATLAAELDIVRRRKGGHVLQLALASSVALIFAFLGALHVFWALGGRLGFASVIPEVNGQRTFTPTPLATFAVALALFIASFIVLGRAGLFGSRAPSEHFKWPVFILGFGLLMRAVGAGRLVGFTKRVRGTSFARWDTRLFSPLCLALSYASLWLAFR